VFPMIETIDISDLVVTSANSLSFLTQFS
jgi:hypothetical protein